MKKLLLVFLLFTQFLSAQFNPVQFFEYGGSDTGFISTWKTDNISTGSSTSTQVKLPLIASGTYNFTVNWGDGNSNIITVYNQAETTHTYSSIGTYVIKITGTITGWQFNNTGDRLKILNILDFSVLKINNNRAFYGCSNLDLASVKNKLDISLTIDLNGTFQNCSNITTINNLNSYDVSHILVFSNLFNGCSKFNQSFNGWTIMHHKRLAKLLIIQLMLFSSFSYLLI